MHITEHIEKGKEMTIEQAESIRDLLVHRDNLIAELREFERCQCITGHINDAHNGLGFTWDRNSRQVRCLIDGIQKEIAYIDEYISNIKIQDGNGRVDDEQR